MNIKLFKVTNCRIGDYSESWNNLDKSQAIKTIANFIEAVDHVHAEKIVDKLKLDFVYSFIIDKVQYTVIYDAINSEF